jgi:hypothetical protein
MGRPLKIQKLNAGITTDAGFPQFANLDPGTQVIPVGMTSTEFLGVVGGANAGIATSTFPVVQITANVNGQQGAAYIITQKGTYKYLVSGEDTVTAGSFTPGFSYQILSLGNTDFTAIGAGVNPQVGQVFTATNVGSGTGTASDAGQCVLVANATISSGQMNMTFQTGGANVYASRLTNKYIWDGSTPPNRYAVNFFAPEGVLAAANVAITGNAGTFSSNAYSTYYVGDTVTVSGTDSGTGNIVGYTDPTTYYIINTDGSTVFTLSATLGGANVVTNAGNTTGLTFTVEGATTTTVKSGADSATWTGTSGPANTQNITLAQVQNYTS